MIFTTFSANAPERLRELWIHTNNSCNLACRHCLVNSSPAGDPGLPSARIMDIIDSAAACGAVRFYFTGGEPFARRDIFELIERVTGRHGAELIILTNATLFHGERLERLGAASRERVRLQISLDGARAETNDRLRGPGTFEEIRRGTLNVTRLGFSVSIATVVMKENLAEIPEITRLVKEWGAQSQHLDALASPFQHGRSLTSASRGLAREVQKPVRPTAPSSLQDVEAARVLEPPIVAGDREWLRLARRARLLAWASLAWLTIEGTVGVVAGLIAGSIALIAAIGVLVLGAVWLRRGLLAEWSGGAARLALYPMTTRTRDLRVHAGAAPARRRTGRPA